MYISAQTNESLHNFTNMCCKHKNKNEFCFVSGSIEVGDIVIVVVVVAVDQTPKSTREDDW